MTDLSIPGMQIVRLPIASLTPHPRNPRQHPENQVRLLVRSLSVHGQQRPVVVTPDNVILAGHGLTMAAHDLGWTEIDCVVYSGANPDAFLAMDNQSSNYAYDDTEKLVDLLRALQSQDTVMEDAGFDTDEVTFLFRDLEKQNTPANGDNADAMVTSDDDDDEEEDGVMRPASLTKDDVPDAIWATNNDWDIPMLDTHWQADALDAPVNKWGVGRKAIGSGTIHFYTEDAKFEHLWKNPQHLVNYGTVSVVEPNFSTNVQMPRAVVLYHVYRKRWMARYWQSKGIRVFVDLNVPDELSELNLIGVPDGWRAYATRGVTAEIDSLPGLWEVACRKAGTDDVLFVVIGGREPVKDVCQQHGWIHVYEHQHLVHGRVTKKSFTEISKNWNSKANRKKRGD